MSAVCFHFVLPYRGYIYKKLTICNRLDHCKQTLSLSSSWILAAVCLPWLRAYLFERQFSQQFLAKENHSGHPEEQNVMPSLKQGTRVEQFQVLSLVRPAKNGEGEKARGHFWGTQLVQSFLIFLYQILTAWILSQEVSLVDLKRL